MPRYRLNVTAHGKPGFYESESIAGLLVTMIKHRLQHLVSDGKWTD